MPVIQILLFTAHFGELTYSADFYAGHTYDPDAHKLDVIYCHTLKCLDMQEVVPLELLWQTGASTIEIDGFPADQHVMTARRLPLPPADIPPPPLVDPPPGDLPPPVNTPADTSANTPADTPANTPALLVLPPYENDKTLWHELKHSAAQLSAKKASAETRDLLVRSYSLMRTPASCTNPEPVRSSPYC